MRTNHSPSIRRGFRFGNFIGLVIIWSCTSDHGQILLAQSPGIAFPPKQQQVVLYHQAAFGVIAQGTAPLSYQWFKDGVLMAGATNDQVVITKAEFSDAGSYSVTILNAEGKAASPAVHLTVNAPKAGDLDGSFLHGGAIDGVIHAIAVQPNGKILIGGAFTTVHGAARGGVARLHADGTTDYTFMQGLPGASGADAWITSALVQPDGKVLIGGVITLVNAVKCHGVARLNADGSLEEGFQSTNLFKGGTVSSIALQNDGKLLLGGSFRTLNGFDRNLARLNVNGTLDTGLLGEPHGYNVNIVAVQNDGKMLIGGVATNSMLVARLNANGTLDGGFQDEVSRKAGYRSAFSILALRNGKALVGGGRTFPPDSFIESLELDGRLDSGFQGVVSGADWNVWGLVAFAEQSDGKVVVVGSFTKVNGVRRNGIARLHTDGTLDEGFHSVLPILSFARSVAVQTDGRILLGGRLLSMVEEGSPRNILRLNRDGNVDTSFLDGLAGANHAVNSVAQQSDGKVLIAGQFTSVNGVPAARIARLWGNADVPPRLRALKRSGDEITLTWDALPGRKYVVQYGDSISAGSWIDLPGEITGPASGIGSKSDSSAGRTLRRFYRVVLLRNQL